MKSNCNTTHTTPTLSRRHLLGSGLAALGAFAAKSPILASESGKDKPEAKLRFSTWLIPVKGELEQQLDWAERMGFDAVELRGSIPKDKDKWLKALSRRSLTVSAMDWGNFNAMVSESAPERQKAVDNLKAAIEAAHELKAPALICVPPRLDKGALPDSATTRKILLEVLSPLGELAVKAGTCIAIEPVQRTSVNCLHTVVDVASFCRESGSKGLGLVADFSIMMVEETNITGAFLSGGNFLRQVHLSSRGRKLPGKEAEDEQQYLEGFRGLKMIGYQKYCSFECGRFEPYEKDVTKSIAFLQDIWARA